ncbi:hypothetical protein SADUNF_Sadunf10G0152600 [Salix dunnii]|uniref:Mitochondrial glycoprotein family protein n=1 Tax=Salix dunnii TaxID=1413687 RepID=A0A835JNY6_9ROSI|nr:hypothetical protein SADUNF_Sadunf10G0152600 [Salix dunnii]
MVFHFSYLLNELVLGFEKMSLTAVLRKTASTAAPLAGRIFRVGQRDYHSALFPSLKHQVSLPRKNPSLVVPFVQCFCSTVTETQRPSSTEPLLRALESEIKVAQETVDHDHVEEIPKDYPFKIDDNAGQQTVILTREYEGELVRVECGTCLEFNCVAYADDIKIDSMSIIGSETSEDQMAYDGPNFHDFDEKLKKGFHKYLEIRGIKASTTNFLHEYMINKDSREYTGWLSNLKQFIEA